MVYYIKVAIIVKGKHCLSVTQKVMDKFNENVKKVKISSNNLRH